MKTGERVKRARTFLKMTQEEFGKVAGVSKAAVSQWENGVTTPQRDALLNLSRKRHLSPEWITSGRGEMVEVDRGEPAPESPLTVDQAEILALWAKLMPDEQAEMLATIKEKAARNIKVAEQFAPPDVHKRTVSVSERRLANLPAPFANRRKDHG